MLTNTLTRHADLIARNNEICQNLIKVNLNLGAVMAQGLSANANVQLAEKAINFFVGRILK